MKFFVKTVLFLFVLFLAYPQPIVMGQQDNAFFSKAGKLIDNGGFAVERDGQLFVSHNLYGMYVPASIVKIATAQTALHILGPDYRFATHFYVDSADNLYIKGFGDPFLVSEEVSVIMDRLQQHGLHTINNIFIDHSAYQIAAPTDGLGFSDNPYDALNSSLAVNFNTVNILVTANGVVQSAEDQTPTLPLMLQLGKNRKPGSYRINISTDEKNGQANISQYAGELFRKFQHQKGMPGTGEIAEKAVPENLEPVYVHKSGKALQEIVEPLMLYSNNFIANQLFLACGVKQYGYPATWEKGRRALSEYMQNTLSLTEKDIIMVEGSGLSRRNRISARAMLVLLRSFRPYAHLMPLEDNRRIKSGTLKGVYSYAGYFMDSGKLDSFVLILNQSGNTRDKLLKLLEEVYWRSEVRSEEKGEKAEGSRLNNF